MSASGLPEKKAGPSLLQKSSKKSVSPPSRTPWTRVFWFFFAKKNCLLLVRHTAQPRAARSPRAKPGIILTLLQRDKGKHNKSKAARGRSGEKQPIIIGWRLLTNHHQTAVPLSYLFETNHVERRPEEGAVPPTPPVKPSCWPGKGFHMSYIATSRLLPLQAETARSHVSAAGLLNDPALTLAPLSPTGLVSTGLEATLGVAIMAGMSLVFCTIAAGALL